MKIKNLIKNNKSSILLTLSLFWTALCGSVASFWAGLFYMFIFGQASGTNTETSDENLALAMGIFILVFGIVCIVPNMIWSCLKLKKYHKWLSYLPLVIFFMCLIVRLLSTGFEDFSYTFNL